MKPEISVIIPTYNRAAIVARCMEAFKHQTLARHEFELIVSDDGSTDNTGETVACLKASCPFAVQYLHQPNRGANAARNRAVEAARSDLLLFINDDTIAVPRMLAEHVRCHRTYPEEYVAVLGRMTVSPEVPHSVFARLHLDGCYEQWGDAHVLDWRAFFTCNVSVKKMFLLQYGMFEESIRYHEDVELAERLSHYGLEVRYCQEALGYHDHFLTEKDYFGMARRDGEALARWYVKSPQAAAALEQINFSLTPAPCARFKYLCADALFNPVTRGLFVAAARLAARCSEDIALLLYKKLYEAVKRESIRKEMKKLKK